MHSYWLYGDDDFITFLGVNISVTIELRVFFSEKVNNFSRVVLNLEMNLQYK